MVEYLVGDGPNNRYALICSQCRSHNGMALRDEFEYLSFRCAYCYQLNPARKKKPTLEVVGVADSTHPPNRERMGSTASNKDDEVQVNMLTSYFIDICVHGLYVFCRVVMPKGMLLWKQHLAPPIPQPDIVMGASQVEGQNPRVRKVVLRIKPFSIGYSYDSIDHVYRAAARYIEGVPTHVHVYRCVCVCIVLV